MSEFSIPRAAASVILCRQGRDDLEVYLVKRHGRAGFMANAHVFPGGITEPGDGDSLARSAARELFEEAGVLLGDPEPDPTDREDWRKRLVNDESDLEAFCRATGTIIDTSALHYFSEWITPSHERRRYLARFFVAEMPQGQEPSPDHRETVSGRWVAVQRAAELATELELPPPQLRTFYDLKAATSLAELRDLCAQRAEHPMQILPRVAPTLPPITLLLPWDPDYQELGQGQAQPVESGHPMATGPSRVVLKDGAWRLE